MKTGTTFLQKFMFANQDNLRAAGCLVAGESTHELARKRYQQRLAEFELALQTPPDVPQPRMVSCNVMPR